MELTKDVKYIKGVGPNRVKLLNKLGIFSLYDLITYFPRQHEDRSKPKNIIDVSDGEETLIQGMCVSKMSEIRIRKGLTIYKILIRDETGTCTITWYNQSYLKGKFIPGNTYSFFGKCNFKRGNLEMNSPVFDVDRKS